VRPSSRSAPHLPLVRLADSALSLTGLQARRERRRAKALIRKDRTLTAAAVGTAAAEEVKASRRRQRAASDGESDDDQENEGVARKKVKRTTKEGRSRKVVQEMGKAKNVTSGRLTVRPSLSCAPLCIISFH